MGKKRIKDLCQVSKEAYNYPWKNSKICVWEARMWRGGEKNTFFSRQSVEFGKGIWPESATPTDAGE